MPAYGVLSIFVTTATLYLLAINVQAGASISRRVLVGSAGPAPGPSPGAPKDVRIDTASGFAATLVSGASGLAKQIVDRTQGLASAADKVEDNLGITKRAPILLMHGAIQGGWVWEFPRISQGAARGVKGLLEAAGYTVYNPTLPYHSPTDAWNPTDGEVQVQTYVDTFLKVITDQNLQNVILVGHSLAGVWMQQMLQQMPERIGMMVFVDAVVLETGESFFSNKIAGVLSPHSEYPAQAFFTITFSYPFFYQVCNRDVYRTYFVNTAANNTAFVTATYAGLVPEPHGPEMQTQNTTAFFQIPVPKAFVLGTQDVGLSGGYRSWLLFSDRLAEANNGNAPFRVHEIYGDHESMLTQPQNLAKGILQAIHGMQMS
ncbi:hypothetical protein CVIRNUC_001045 [Coccomyxa viridis]|uniref:AB hydrolase-1 domain-containing protein n=1 Tax=Coccomyxa viridis TaxID=1274662 RepID=A0AAV1HSJ5_9CHLO|nr:hypothetical protein CVIRNUC_001045 [Coccomyxa viridis]